MVKDKRTKGLLTKPLAWLDKGETRSQQWLTKYFGLNITAFENTVNVVSFAIDELAESMKASPLRVDDLKLRENREQMRQFVEIALLVEALDSFCKVWFTWLVYIARFSYISLHCSKTDR